MRCKEGEALDFIQNGYIELDGELPLNTFGSSLGTGRIHGLWHIIGTSSRARCRPRAAPARAKSRTPTCRSSAPAPRSYDVHLRRRSLLRLARSRRRAGTSLRNHYEEALNPRMRSARDSISRSSTSAADFTIRPRFKMARSKKNSGFAVPTAGSK